MTTNETKVTIKRTRRGITNATQATTRLHFSEKDAAPNGLFVAAIDSVSVDWSVGSDGKAFAGLKVPRLTVHVTSLHANVNERRYVALTFFPVESNVDTIEGGKSAWRVDALLNWGKHLLDIFYLKNRELTDEEVDALSLTFEDYVINENTNEIEYVPVDPQDVLDGYRHYFENLAAMLNGTFNLKDGDTPKPCYKTADGKMIPCWIKLLRCTKSKNEWRNVGQNGELAFTTFVGEGGFEIIQGGVQKPMPPRILKVDFSKEDIRPHEIKKAPNAGIPQLPGMGGISVAPMGSEMNNVPTSNEAFAAAQSDMPF